MFSEPLRHHHRPWQGLSHDPQWIRYYANPLYGSYLASPLDRSIEDCCCICCDAPPISTRFVCDAEQVVNRIATTTTRKIVEPCIEEGESNIMMFFARTTSNYFVKYNRRVIARVCNSSNQKENSSAIGRLAAVERMNCLSIHKKKLNCDCNEFFATCTVLQRDIKPECGERGPPGAVFRLAYTIQVARRKQEGLGFQTTCAQADRR